MKKKYLSKNENEHLFTIPSVSLITWILIGVCFIPLASSGAPEPEIEIVKIGPTVAYAGEQITYTYYVSNPKHQPLSNVSVVDDLLGPATYVSGEQNHNEMLDHSETWIFTCTTTPDFNEIFPDQLTNIATAEGTWVHETHSAMQHIVHDTDSHTLYPFILRKDVRLNQSGEIVTYDDPDTLFSIQILKDGEILDTFSFNESSPKCIWLSPGVYNFTEINVPEGYIPDHDSIFITAGEISEYTFINIIGDNDDNGDSNDGDNDSDDGDDGDDDSGDNGNGDSGNNGDNEDNGNSEEGDSEDNGNEDNGETGDEQTTQTTRINHGYRYNDIAPVANANGPYNGFIHQEILFNGSKSSDADGLIILYRWSFGDGIIAEGATISHSYINAGIYPVTLTVIDNFGATDIDRTNVTIIVPNSPPTTPLIAGPKNGYTNTGYSYIFGAFDNNSDYISYLIDWGDGFIYQTPRFPCGQHFVLLHRWSDPGTYTITVTASDGSLASIAQKDVVIQQTLVVNNIWIIALALLALIALLLILLLSRKKNKNEE
ncbi:hypothetical protein AYK25_07800 [Thermoplasmatales archaeon SM1-50]|nr:MAG: hypothetical protein AYK25_07800 [Thermoplasmatales archaeon SM1-50]